MKYRIQTTTPTRHRCQFFVLFMLWAVSLACQSGRPPIIPLRYLENYRFLADPEVRRMPLDGLKYLPVGKGKSYFSFGGNARLGHERLGNRMGETRVYNLLRTMLHADAHLGNGLRVFAQLANGRELGSIMPRPIDEDKAYVLNLFADLQLSKSATSSLRLRLGRFEMNYGSGRLITLREGPTLRHSWDGARLRWQTGSWTIDALATEYVINQTGYFDNNPFDSSQRLWGVYATNKGDRSILDIYYLGYNNPNRPFFNDMDLSDSRHTIGSRVSVTGTVWDIEAETMLQYVEAGAAAGANKGLAPGAALNAGRTWRAGDWSFRVGLKLDYWSGDRDSLDNRVTNFNPMYVRQGYYQGAGAVFASNFFDVHPSLLIRPGKKTSLRTSINWYWRSSPEDGVYVGGVGIPALPPDPLNTSRYLGRQLDLTLRHSFNRYLSLTAVYSRFQPGGFVAPTPTPLEIRNFLNVLFWAAF